MKFFKIGMRTIKTVLAVMITLAISEWINLESPILAGVAAIMTMEASVSESFIAGKNRIYGTIIGALIALGISYIVSSNFWLKYILIAIGLILLISLCNYLKLEKAIRMSLVVFLTIIIGIEGDKFSYTLNRTWDTLMGVVIGTAINYFIRPPKTDQYIKDMIFHIYQKQREIAHKAQEDEIFDDDNLKEDLQILEEKYKVFLNDIKYDFRLNKDKEKYLLIFSAFERVNTHISILDEINFQAEGSEMNQIYNYHLDKILYELDRIGEEI